MSDLKLGRLEKVNLREAWANEAGDFTPWLAQDDNIKLLGEAIGIELEVEAQEKEVGPFRADILCKDVNTEGWVLIENQLERTDHTHLGQLITYAAGLDAVTIVWIAQQFTDQHRAALDWLNDMTPSGIAFFGLELELWKIGDSPPAPKFNVVSSPNEWIKTGTAVKKSSDGKRLDYWTQFQELVLQEAPQLSPPTPHDNPSFKFNAKYPGIDYRVQAANLESGRISAGLGINGKHARTLFSLLKRDHAAIEDELGMPLKQQELPNRSLRQLRVVKSADVNDRDDWPQQHQWLLASLLKVKDAFDSRIQSLPAIGELEDEDGTGDE